jgi:hypothetical protein
MGREPRKKSASHSDGKDLAGTITRGSMIVIIALGISAAILILLTLGGLKVITGDFPPGFIMLLAAGFMSSLIAGWYIKRYQGQLVVLGISMLTIAGIIWAIFEDGYIGKAFMLLLVVTSGFMAVLGFYNVFIRKKQPNMHG